MSEEAAHRDPEPRHQEPRDDGPRDEGPRGENREWTSSPRTESLNPLTTMIRQVKEAPKGSKWKPILSILATLGTAVALVILLVLLAAIGSAQKKDNNESTKQDSSTSQGLRDTTVTDDSCTVADTDLSNDGQSEYKVTCNGKSAQVKGYFNESGIMLVSNDDPQANALGLVSLVKTNKSSVTVFRVSHGANCSTTMDLDKGTVADSMCFKPGQDSGDQSSK